MACCDLAADAPAPQPGGSRCPPRLKNQKLPGVHQNTFRQQELNGVFSSRSPCPSSLFNVTTQAALGEVTQSSSVRPALTVDACYGARLSRSIWVEGKRADAPPGREPGRGSPQQSPSGTALRGKLTPPVERAPQPAVRLEVHSSAQRAQLACALGEAGGRQSRPRTEGRPQALLSDRCQTLQRRFQALRARMTRLPLDSTPRPAVLIRTLQSGPVAW